MDKVVLGRPLAKVKLPGNTQSASAQLLFSSFVLKNKELRLKAFLFHSLTGNLWIKKYAIRSGLLNV